MVEWRGKRLYSHRMKVNKMNYWPTYSLVGVLLVMICALVLFVYRNNQETSARMAREAEKNLAANAVNEVKVAPEDAWKVIYPDTKPMKIGGVEMLASVAESWPDRIKGLSETPYLPDNVVKLFIFDSPGQHSIWMKDMNYSIDIIWVDENNSIVFIKEEAAPESYPAMFVPDSPAKYVIETASGFVKKNAVILGDKVVLPNL